MQVSCVHLLTFIDPEKRASILKMAKFDMMTKLQNTQSIREFLSQHLQNTGYTYKT